MQKNLILKIAGLSDSGCTRDHNEDYIVWDSQMGFVLLADGMGGHNAGEVASEMAAKIVMDSVQEKVQQLIPNTDPAADIIDISMNAVNLANEKIYQASIDNPIYSGMGTTVVLALFKENSVTIAHVGDSRIYRLRDQELEQLTIDHSLMEEVVTQGYLSREEALLTVNKNTITRALGVHSEIEIDVQYQEVKTDDLYILCSDGLSDLVPFSTINTLIKDSGFDLNRAAQDLIRSANENGGYDNISVILVHVTEQ